MSDEQPQAVARLQPIASEPSIAGLLDQICDRFEAACKGESLPRLEDYLHEIPTDCAEQGFRELLELELAYRRRAGQMPNADDYRSRFPHYATTIERLFTAGDGRATVVTPNSETVPVRVVECFSDVVPASSQGTVSGPGRTVGTATSSGLRFRVLRKHARGGLGEVFIAEDQELHREVALKQIQSQYADDTDSRTRFILEAEVTGALEHPGIVPVYGLGSYNDGRPFYAMRFIHGDSLKDAIDFYHDIDMGPKGPGERELELRKLLGRFVDVCNAIEYAHSRGIVHRDLKPGNVMLGNFGETLVVDWGLAKQIDQPESPLEVKLPEPQSRPMMLSGTAATRMGSAIGTPQYMSPEQAAGALDQIGPRSDVYSLGSTLYCLLTGKAPLSDQPSFDLAELLRRVKAGEIPPPREIYFGVPKGLEAICQKAMALRPEQRYQSARQLADDVEHWLADEPISALADTRGQIVARWVRRHRSLALASAIALVVISLVSIVAMVLINQERRIADRLAVDKSNLAVEKSNLADSEQQARKRAELGFHEASTAVDDLFTKVSENTLLNQPGMQGVRRELLNKTLVYYKRFLDEGWNDPALQDEMALTFFHVGRIVEELDSPVASLRYYQQAEEKQQHLLIATPNDRSRLWAFGETLNAYGGAFKAAQRQHEALQAFEHAREIRQKLSALDPLNPEYARAFANSVMNIGMTQGALFHSVESLQELTAAQNIRAAHLADKGDLSKLERDFAMGSYNLGNEELRVSMGQKPKSAAQAAHRAAAQKDFEQCIAGISPLIEHDPRDLELQFQVATCYRMIGNCQFQAAPPAANQSYRQALDAFGRLVERNPDVSKYKLALAETYMDFTSVESSADAMKSFDQARVILNELTSKFPDNPLFARDLNVTLQLLAGRQMAAGMDDAARANLEASLKLLERLRGLLKSDPNIVQQQTEARNALEQLDARKARSGKPSEPKRSAAPQKPPVLPSQRTP